MADEPNNLTPDEETPQEPEAGANEGAPPPEAETPSEPAAEASPAADATEAPQSPPEDTGPASPTADEPSPESAATPDTDSAPAPETTASDPQVAPDPGAEEQTQPATKTKRTAADNFISPEELEAFAAQTGQSETIQALRDHAAQKAADAAEPPATPPPDDKPDSAVLSQDELDALTAQLKNDADSGDTTDSAVADAQGELDAMANDLLNEVGVNADAAPAEADGPRVIGAKVPGNAAEQAAPLETPAFDEGGTQVDLATIELLDDVELDVKIELGRSQMFIEDVLRLGIGSVVELDKLAGDPVDIYVNERLVARGEVLVLNDNFCVRINDILSSITEVEEEQ